MPTNRENDKAKRTTGRHLQTLRHGRHRRPLRLTNHVVSEKLGQMRQSAETAAQHTIKNVRVSANRTRESVVNSQTYTQLTHIASDINNRTRLTFKEASGRDDKLSFLSKKAANFTVVSARSARMALAEQSSAQSAWRGILGLFVLALLSMTVLIGPVTSQDTSPTGATLAADSERGDNDRADRSNRDDDQNATTSENDETSDESADKGDEEEKKPAEEEKPEKQPEEKKEAPAPKPVGGLDEAQMANAVIIVETAKDLGINEKGQAIGLATAMQESQMRNLANNYMPESLNLPNQGTGQDHDSVGIFQQRPSSGWGTIKECMDVKYAATVFFKSLKNVNGWNDMPLTVAAQTVQVSAFPDAYAKWETLAWDIVEEVNG